MALFSRRKKVIEHKTCVSNSSTTFVWNFFFSENRAVYEIMWENMVHPDRQQMTIWRMRIACWVTKAKNTHSEYVIPIAFPMNNGCKNSPQGYVIRTLPVLFSILLSPTTHHPFSSLTFHMRSESFDIFSIIALTALLPCIHILQHKKKCWKNFHRNCN